MAQLRHFSSRPKAKFGFAKGRRVVIRQAVKQLKVNNVIVGVLDVDHKQQQQLISNNRQAISNKRQATTRTNNKNATFHKLKCMFCSTLSLKAPFVCFLKPPLGRPFHPPGTPEPNGPGFFDGGRPLLE